MQRYKSHRRRALSSPAIIAAALGLTALTVPLHAQTIPWTNSAGGTFNTAANWNSGAGPVPGAANTAQFNIPNTYAVTFNLNPINSGLSVGGSNVSFRPDTVAFRTYTVNGNANVTAGSLTLAAPTSGSNSLTLNLGSNALTVNSGTNFNINASNDVLCSTFNLATNAAGTASTTIDGSGSLLAVSSNAVLGTNGGVANLIVQNNASATFAAMFVASSAVAGTGGSVTVQSGADISSLGNLSLGTGSATGQVSTFTVTGTGSTVTQTGGAFLSIGSTIATSSAKLDLLSNGSFTTGTGTTTINPNGTLNLSAGALTANGDISIPGGTFTYTAGTLTWAPSNAMTISNGGEANLAFFALPTASIVTVTGAGSELNMATSLFVWLGASMTISNGGDFTAGLFLDIGTAGNGSVVVDGPGSTLTVNTNGTNSVGTDATGVLTLRNNSTSTYVGGLQIGLDAGSSGTVEVLSGATLSCGSIFIADDGTAATGSLNVTGGTLTQSGASTLIVGAASASDATVTVGVAGVYNSGTGLISVNPTGQINIPGGTFNANGNLSLAGGDLTLTAGATLTVAPARTTTLSAGSTLTITDSSASLSTLNVAGGNINFVSGSLAYGGDLTVGAGGLLGVNLTLDSSRTLALTGTTTISPGRQLNITGGSFSTGSLVNNGSFNFTSGTLSLTGPAGLTIGSGGLLGATVSATAGKTFNITGPTTVATTGRLLIADGTFNAIGGIINSGEIRITGLSPTLTGGFITNARLIRGDGRIDNSVTNTATGELRAEPGSTLLLAGANGTNSGKINLQGGTIQFSQSLTNGATGTITGSGFLYVDQGLNNNGQVQFSAGVTSVYGPVTNNTQIIVSGGGTTSFYAGLLMSPGSTFQTSTNSTSVFFGPVTGTGSFTGPGIKNFEGGGPGSLLATIATISGTTRIGPNATVEAGSFHEASVLVEGTLLLTPGGNTSRTTLLQLDPSALLSLADNSLLVDYSAASPISTLISYFTSGQMTVNGDASGLPTYLAISEAADLGLTTFNGIAVDDTTVLAKYTYVGDANLDGQVDALDYERVDLAIGNTGVFGTAQGDLNYDGNVDALDYEQIDLNIGNGVGSPLATVLIPEPSSLTTLVALSLLALRRRK